jgi:pyruvate kinase
VCAVLLDTKGPEIRTGMLVDGKAVELVKGAKLTLTTDYGHLGTASRVAVSYKHLARDVKAGGKILMADGAVLLEVVRADTVKGEVECTCLNTAKLGERKNVNLPGVVVDLPTLTEKDEDDLVNWGVKNSVDFIAASFVRKGSDVRAIRAVLAAAAQSSAAPGGAADASSEGDVWGSSPPTGIRIVAKVENQEGLANFDDILHEADGIMVARGDLGMEIPLEKMFWVQKSMIRKCNLVGKPVVTATQMLDSMITNPRPTRAEATDVANAVLDGTDCVMLSGETAAGAYAVEAVEIMAGICEEAEACVDNFALCQNMLNATLLGRAAEPMTTIESLASSAVLTAAKVQAACIVVLAANGSAARLIAKYRPSQPVVVGVVPRARRGTIGFSETTMTGHAVARQCLLTRGLVPVLVSSKNDEKDAAVAAKQCVNEAIDFARANGLVKPGQPVVTMYNVERQCAVIRVVVCPGEVGTAAKSGGNGASME